MLVEAFELRCQNNQPVEAAWCNNAADEEVWMHGPGRAVMFEDHEWARLAVSGLVWRWTKSKSLLTTNTKQI